MKFSQLESICQGKIVRLSRDQEIKELVTDTRKISVRSGGLFFAIQGVNLDGHKYASEAYESGVRCFVVEKEVKLPDDANIIQVESAISALQAIAADHRSQFKCPVIGITGSNGKTIVKEWLAQMLDHRYSVVKSPKSYNSQIGVPLSVWQMSDRHNVAIFEAGISQLGEMTKLQAIIKPSLGIFTNLGEAHNAGFSSKTQKATEKAHLFEHSKKVIYRVDYEEIHDALSKTIKNKSALIGWQLTSQTANQYTIKVGNESLSCRLKFSDEASVENCLHCAVAMHILGFGQEIIQSRLDTLSTVKMRLEMKQAVNRSYVIDDTYNNDLHGLEIALGFLNGNKQKNKRSVILSDLYQTGLDPDQLYAKVAEMIKNHKINRLIGVGSEIKRLAELLPIECVFFADTEELLQSSIKMQDEIVLVKGSRNFEFERVVDQLEYKAHGTVLEVNLENLVHNLNYFRSKLEPTTKVMAMVKAYAYGGGNHEIANLLQFHKLDYLGVAYTDEAVDLRKNGVHMPVMIMNPSPDSFRLLKEFNLEPEIYSLEQFYDFIAFFEGEDTAPGIHIKLETGMNRLGFGEGDIKRLVELLKIHKKINVKSIFSHLAGSEDIRHNEYTQRQAERFDVMSRQLMNGLWYKPLRHLLNTGGIIRHPYYQYDMVRLGIGLYGYDPTEQFGEEIHSVGTLKSNISQVKLVKAGESIGYGRAGVAQRDMKVAVVPIGYADGYVRAFGNGVGKMLVAGKRVPTVGNVCMDMTMLDVSEITAHSGDEVIIFGDDPKIGELASWVNTIPYEILTNVSQRVKRVFVSG